MQMIDDSGSRHFDMPGLLVEQGAIYVGDCVFSRRGAIINLPGVYGHIVYGPFAELRSPIMGPFCRLPMECQHEIISMDHDLFGSITVDGRKIVLDGGRGYLEKDSGTSFPRAYLWLHCNAFSKPCSIMVSIASIPFLGLRFTGCICAILFAGREYRIATYRGVRILARGPERITLLQGRLWLQIEIERPASGHPLRSPVKGRMQGVIHENNQAHARFRLWERGALIFDLQSEHVGYEYVPHTSHPL